MSGVQSGSEGKLRQLPNEGVLLEFRPLGNSVKVSVIDQDTGIEVSIVGPVSVSEADLRAAAIRKLQYVPEKNK